MPREVSMSISIVKQGESISFQSSVSFVPSGGALWR